MLDNRLVHTTKNLNTIRDPIFLTPTSDYVTLLPGHKVWYSASDVNVATGAVIPINTQEGLYEAMFTFFTSSTATNWDLFLSPNNITYNYACAYNCIHYDPALTTSNIAASVSTTNYPGFYCDLQIGTADAPPGAVYIVASTYTTRKQVMMYAADNDGAALCSDIWDDTTTVWSKFGTILFKFTSDLTATFNIEGYIARIL